MTKATFLENIIRHKRVEIRRRKTETSASVLLREARERSEPLSLASALRNCAHLPVVAELKKASPSAGVIRPDFDVQRLALDYQANGAAALSVLTDEAFFQGSIDFIRALRSLIDLPLLRKDFIIDPYQVVEARAAGADAVLLIVAALSTEQLSELQATAHELGMDALVETHNAAEMTQALGSAATLVGVNNRDLHRFTVDLAVTEQVAAMAPESVTLVAESGIFTAADARRMLAAGASAVLVGTHFMKAASPGIALRRLIDAFAEEDTR